MEDQKVSFHVAKIAYELGFRIKTKYVYDIKYTTPKAVLKSFSMCCIDDFKGRYCYIPTQSLLHRWLREKFGLHLTVMHINNLIDVEPFEWIMERQDALYTKSERITFRLPKVSHKRISSSVKFKTWEGALEDGLMEGMLMIRNKIVLENNKLS